MLRISDPEAWVHPSESGSGQSFFGSYVDWRPERSATVREMTAAFQIFGNQGQYNKPYTYYYVEDHDGNVIIDNRDNASTQAISAVNAGVMNKLLTYAVNYGTGKMARIPGWETYGKTGTTDNDRDSWFIGGTPYAVEGIWTGYKNPARITGPSLNAAKVLWKQVMTKYLADKPAKKFDFSDDLVAATYCESSGFLALCPCTDTGTGWTNGENCQQLAVLFMLLPGILQKYPPTYPILGNPTFRKFLPVVRTVLILLLLRLRPALLRHPPVLPLRPPARHQALSRSLQLVRQTLLPVKEAGKRNRRLRYGERFSAYQIIRKQTLKFLRLFLFICAK